MANRSSIVLLLEQGRKAAVLTRDAYPAAWSCPAGSGWRWRDTRVSKVLA